MRRLSCLVLLLLALAHYVRCEQPDAAASPPPAAAAAETAEEEEDDTPKMPMPPVILSRHMAGAWTVAWHHGCTRYTTPGEARFVSPTEAYWQHRDISGEWVHRQIAGEGTNLSYIPLLTQMEMPKSGERRDFVYQVCSASSVVIPTPQRDPAAFLQGMNATETRVFRGFAGQKISDTFILDRCAGGQNKNYNLFVTTIGQELIKGEEEIFGPSTRKFHEVRFQFRLPGKVGCAPETIGERKDLPDPTKNVFWSDNAQDALVNEGYEIIVFRRSDRDPSLNANKGWLQSGNAIFAFAVLFMLVRVYTSYRYSRQKMEQQQDIMKEVVNLREKPLLHGGRKQR
jgi:hypothetical protein